MDMELVKYMAATRDLIYAVLGLNALVTIAVVLHIATGLKRLFASAQNGWHPHDPVTMKHFTAELAKAAMANAARTNEAVRAVIDAFEKRHQAQMAEYRYQRKKMNMLLIIMRRIHDFTIFERKPVTDLPPLDESEEASEDVASDKIPTEFYDRSKQS